MKTYYVDPMGKPRMTRSDKWNQRDCVMRYRAFKDAVRAAGIKIPEDGYHIVFVIPMPASWSIKRRADMVGKPHQTKPDKDNLEKALLDAVFEEDSHIWDGRVSKIWGYGGEIRVGII